MRIGVFVGSFNPVHKGHKHIIDFLINKQYVDKIIVIATGSYWDKTNLLKLEHRINMLKVYESNNVIIDTELNNIEYTYQILNTLKNKNPQNDYYLIIGADNILKLNKWENIEEILNYKIIVLDRGDIDIISHINKFNKKNNFIVLKDFSKINISSTDIRNDLEKNKENLDEKVYEYIIKNKLFEK